MADISTLSADDLFAMARTRRAEAFGTVVTYSPKVFIPLTMLCRDKCGYCTFAQPPAVSRSRTSNPKTCWRSPVAARRWVVTKPSSPSGRNPEARYPVARDWLNRHGYESTVHYVAAMAQLVLDETGCSPTPTPAR